jgi:omega-amidase
MHIAAVQFDIAWEDRAANHAKVRSLLDSSPPPRGGMIVLPEMFASGFSMNVKQIAQDESRLDERFVREISTRHGLWTVAGVVGRGAGGRGRNEAVVCNPEGQLVARYCKLYPFSPAGEKEAYECGQDIVTFPCGEHVVAPFICYDLRFPEVFRRAVQKGATVMPVIANWPDTREQHRRVLLCARAIENQCYIVGVNRIGTDPQHRYAGGSIIVSPRGEILMDAGDREGVFGAELDIAALNDVRRSLPFLRDIREEFLAG